MCTVSHIGDQWVDTAPKRYPDTFITYPPVEVSKGEFDALKADVEELKLLLKAAKRYDEATGQPDCETEDKVGLLRRLAKLVGVDLEDVLVTAEQDRASEGENRVK